MTEDNEIKVLYYLLHEDWDNLRPALQQGLLAKYRENLAIGHQLKALGTEASAPEEVAEALKIERQYQEVLNYKKPPAEEAATPPVDFKAWTELATPDQDKKPMKAPLPPDTYTLKMAERYRGGAEEWANFLAANTKPQKPQK